jgi:hypothetical protein
MVFEKCAFYDHEKQSSMHIEDCFSSYSVDLSKTILSLLRYFHVFLISLVLCILSSIIIQLPIAWFTIMWRFSPLQPQDCFVLFLLAVAIVFGMLKSLPVSSITYLVKASLRWWMMTASTVLLSSLEGIIYWEIATWTFPFG